MDIASGLNAAQSSKSDWRRRPEFYFPADDCDEFEPGLLNMSPAWYESGHDVRTYYSSTDERALSRKQFDNLALPTTSPLLKTKRGKEWCRRMRRVNALISGMLRVMHPYQFQASQRLRTQLDDAGHGLRDMLTQWGALPFNAATLIANRETPYHRDSKTNLRCYDIMTSVGSYTKARMHLKGFGIVIQNMPGTIVAVPGKTTRHGVERGDDERLCLAMYVRESLYERGKVRLPDWPEQSLYSSYIGPRTAGLRQLQPRYNVFD